MLMSLVHVEQMIAFLDTDIADHKEREGYYDMPMHASGVTVNTLRFGFAADLAASTRNLICVGLALVTGYAMCCGLMLFGAIRYRAACMVPWLVMELLCIVVGLIVFVVFKELLVHTMCGHEYVYCKYWGTGLIWANGVTWCSSVQGSGCACPSSVTPHSGWWCTRCGPTCRRPTS